LGNIFFRKTGWPEVLFLIIVGVIVGPVLNIFPRQELFPILPIISTFTLIMILFHGGMELNLSEVLSGSFRALFQASAYFAIGVAGTSAFLHFIMGWELIDSLMFGSIVSQTGEVVIISMAKRLNLRPESATLVTLEAIITSIFNIVFFFAFLETRLGGTLDFAGTLILVIAKFSIGIVIGGIMGAFWLKILSFLAKEELIHMATIGYIIVGYVASETLGGSGALTVLAIGIVLVNEKEVFQLLRMGSPPPVFSEVKTYLYRFQGEISFLLRTFFFVLLGLMFDTSQSSLLVGLSYGLPVIGILLIVRYGVASVSTWKSPMGTDRVTITGMCALGLTPALLILIPLQYNLPNSYLYTAIVTNIIIATNLITSIAAMKSKRTR
jgi:cell volume regulation protein A